MAIWIIPVIIVGAIVIGLIVGLIVGKSQVKRSRPGYKPLLSRKEKIIYTVLFLGGAALVLIGAFFKFPVEKDTDLKFEEPPIEVAMQKTMTTKVKPANPPRLK